MNKKKIKPKTGVMLRGQAWVELKGIFVGLTVKLKNAKLKFEDRSSWTICNVLGGNLVAIDDTGEIIEPIEAASYVVAIRTASSSATIYELAEITTKINKMDRNIKVLL